MADNTTLNAGSGGDTIATDDIGGVKYQRVKITTGADGSATDVSTANPVPVSDAGGSLTVDGTVALSGTSAISAASLPLPTGAATETSVAATATASGAAADAEATGNGSIIAILKRLRTLLSGGLPAALGANGGLKIEGVASGTVVPVSDGGGSLTVDGTVGVSGTVTTTLSGSPTVDTELTTADLDTGAGTDTRAVVGLALAASGGALLVGSANPVPVSDNSGSLTVDNAGTFAVQATLQAGTAGVGKLTANDGVDIGDVTINNASGGSAVNIQDGGNSITVDGTVSAAQSGTWTVQPGNTANTTAWKVDGSAVTQPVSGTVTASNTAGSVAHDGADSGNPVKVGGRARTSDITAVASDDRTDFITDALGKQITTPYASPENLLVGGTQGTPLTSTTSTQMIAAQAAGVRIYVTSLTITNGHATVGTVVQIRDGSGGTVLWECYCAPAGGGASPTLTTPLRGSAATALHAVCVTTGASITVSVSGYKAAL